MPSNKPIIFHDGVCGLCSRAVKVMRAIDRQAQFHVDSLQSQTALTRLPPSLTQNLSSFVILTKSQQILVKTEALVYFLKHMHQPWWTLGVLVGVLPLPLTNFVYDQIAKYRHLIFKTKVK